MCSLRREPSLNIRSFFTTPSPLRSLTRLLKPLSTKSSDFTREITELLYDLYTRGCKYEKVELTEILEQYTLLGVVDVVIGLNSGELYYVVAEPELTWRDINAVVERLVRSAGGSVEDNLDYSSTQGSLSPSDYNYFKIYSGLGPLLPFVLDGKIEDISLSRSSGRVHVVHSDLSWHGWVKSNVILEPGLVDRIAMTISRKAGKHISITNPLAEGSIKGSIRASIVYGDGVSSQGTSVVIRKKPSELWTITKLINEGTLTSELASYLWLVMERRGWVIIAGPVGAGKTTLLQAMLTLIPPSRKVIIIEDTPELVATSDLWDVLFERVEVFSQVSPIDSYVLLKFALRRRPDYIVIGEVRGVEARLLVQASRLGHGVLNTIHADSSESVIQRLTAPPISIPKNLLNNIWAIVLMSVQGAKRHVVRVSEVSSTGSLIDIFDSSSQGNISVEDIASRCERLKLHYHGEKLREELVERALFLEKLVSKGVFSHRELSGKMLEYCSVRGLSGEREKGVYSVEEAYSQWS